MKGLILVPAFNEEKVIVSVLEKIPESLLGLKIDILVINDGSSDSTGKIVKSFIKQKNKKNIKIVTHLINRGLGAALATGFEYAKDKNYDLLLTLDGDGQHDPKEITKIIKPVLRQQADFVVGTRIYKKGMPITRRLMTMLASFATFVLTNSWTTDSQSGFRAFSKKAINEIEIEVDRMEISSDFFRQAKEKKLSVKEVAIKPIYTDYSTSKGQNFFNSFNITFKLALHKLK